MGASILRKPEEPSISDIQRYSCPDYYTPTQSLSYRHFRLTLGVYFAIIRINVVHITGWILPSKNCAVFWIYDE